jgi:pantetheine-phosphate adenylyltransferase
MAAWIASQKIIVGVTGETRHYVYDIGYMTTGTADDTLLTRKANRDVLESIEQRMQGVLSFLELFRPQITHEIVPISDVYGPTATDPNIQALVVSNETLSGAAASK